MSLIKFKKTIFRIFSLIYSTPHGYRLDYLKSLLGQIKPPLPWINYSAIDFILHRTSEIETVFEYGSGQSTLFWISLRKNVVSIEHDQTFYEKLVSQISEGSNLDYRFIPPEPTPLQDTYDPAVPSYYQSSESKHQTFKRYAEAIDAFNDEWFDIVIIDGRARPSCLAHAVRKIKPNGILVLDNSSREYYLKNTINLFANWKRYDFVGTVRGLLHQEKTSLFIKPSTQAE